VDSIIFHVSTNSDFACERIAIFLADNL